MRTRIRKSDAGLTSYPKAPAPGVIEFIVKSGELSAGLLFELPSGVVAWRLDCGRPAVAKGLSDVEDVRAAGRWFSPHGDRFNVQLDGVRAELAMFEGAKLDAVAKDGALPGNGAVAALSRPQFEYGIQTADMHEYFVSKGDGMTGIVLMRRKDDGWTASVGKTLIPFVLSKEAVRDGVMPPEGVSALPASLERVVPVEHQYWTKKGAEALQARNALAESGLFDERLVKVVDGELRLCTERLFLYEPDAAPGLAKRDVPAALAAILPDLGAWDRLVQPFVAEGQDWRAVAKAQGGLGALTVLSPPTTEVGAVELAALAGELRGDWLIECPPSIAGRDALAKISRPFLLAGDNSRMFAASFRLAAPGLAKWLDAPAALRKALAKKTVEYQGLTIKIDRPTGFVQKGKDEQGNEWERTYKNDYGFIAKTDGGDGEDLDVFVGPDAKSTRVFWVTQNKADGTFDEYKVFVGCATAKQALDIYKAHIPARFFGGIHETPIGFIKSLLGIAPNIEAAKALVAKVEGARDHRVAKAAGVSFQDLNNALREALSQKFKPAETGDGCSPCCGPWVCDTFDDVVVFEHDGALMRIAYTYANGAASLTGEPEKVKRAYVPVSAAPAAPAPATKLAKALLTAAVSKVQVAKEDERYVLGIVLEPETVDAQKDIYSAPEIASAAHLYMTNFQNTGLMHTHKVNDKVRVVESYIAPCDFSIGDQPVKKGSWVMAVKILDDELWGAVKGGTLTGFSIGGSAIREPERAAA